MKTRDHRVATHVPAPLKHGLSCVDVTVLIVSRGGLMLELHNPPARRAPALDAQGDRAADQRGR